MAVSKCGTSFPSEIFTAPSALSIFLIQFQNKRSILLCKLELKRVRNRTKESMFQKYAKVMNANKYLDV